MLPTPHTRSPPSSSSTSSDVVGSLLSFVNIVGDDLKQALDKSAPCKRGIDHRKYMQRQLRMLTTQTTTSRIRLPHDEWKSTTTNEKEELLLKRDDLSRSSNYLLNNAIKMGLPSSSETESVVYPNLQEKQSTHNGLPIYKHANKDTPCAAGCHNVNTVSYNDIKMMSNNESTQNHPSEQSIENKLDIDINEDSDLDIEINVTDPDPLFAKVDTLINKEKTKSESKKSIPFRQRSLPASFFQEPNRPKSACPSKPNIVNPMTMEDHLKKLHMGYLNQTNLLLKPQDLLLYPESFPKHLSSPYGFSGIPPIPLGSPTNHPLIYQRSIAGPKSMATASIHDQLLTDRHQELIRLSYHHHQQQLLRQHQQQQQQQQQQQHIWRPIPTKQGHGLRFNPYSKAPL